MTQRTLSRFHRLALRAACLSGLVAYGTAWSMDGVDASLNGWLVAGGIVTVLALGLYLQSIRRRIA